MRRFLDLATNYSFRLLIKDLGGLGESEALPQTSQIRHHKVSITPSVPSPAGAHYAEITG
jgi:hypothetical protein